jgi:hypothetical protein
MTVETPKHGVGIQAGSEAHPATCPMGTGVSFTGDKMVGE